MLFVCSVGETMRRWRKSFWELERGLIDVIVAGLGRGLLVQISNGVSLCRMSICQWSGFCRLGGYFQFDLPLGKRINVNGKRINVNGKRINV